jgi:aspartate kinase
VSLTGWQAGLLTDDIHGDARVVGLEKDRIAQELKQGKIVVVTGFQGVNSLGDITTLGRGGSDTTAVALAAFLDADQCQIYTDVDGVYDKDPRIFPDAVRYDTMDYDLMLELARQGAQVLHDRCVELGKQYGVQIQVLSSFRPGPGTIVKAII